MELERKKEWQKSYPAFIPAPGIFLMFATVNIRRQIVEKEQYCIWNMKARKNFGNLIPFPFVLFNIFPISGRVKLEGNFWNVVSSVLSFFFFLILFNKFLDAVYIHF